jgi:hypothetical protein
MSNLLEEMTNLLGGDTLTQLSSVIEADPSATGKAMGAGVPALIGAMADEAKAGGAGALLALLNSDASKQNGIADGSILNNLGALFSNPGSFGGANILHTILGSTQPDVENKISRVSGLSLESVAKFLPLLAPIVMGFLGKKVTTEGLDAASLTSFLSDQQGFLKANAPGLLGFLEKIDANDDGSIVDDIQRLFGRLTGRG